MWSSGKGNVRGYEPKRGGLRFESLFSIFRVSAHLYRHNYVTRSSESSELPKSGENRVPIPPPRSVTLATSSSSSAPRSSIGTRLPCSYVVCMIWEGSQDIRNHKFYSLVARIRASSRYTNAVRYTKTRFVVSHAVFEGECRGN